MSRQQDHSEDLFAAATAEIVELLRQQTGLNEQVALRMASQILGVLQAEFAGERVYFQKRAYSESAVLADVAAGVRPAEVCARHQISRNTYYRVVRRTGTRG